MTRTKTETRPSHLDLPTDAHLPAAPRQQAAPAKRQEQETRVTGPTIAKLLAVDTAIRKHLMGPALSLWTYGTNGIALNLPKTPTARLELHKSLPSIPALWRLEERLRVAVDQKTTPDHVAAAFSAILELVPSFKPEDRLQYVRGMIEALSIEADVSKWCPDAVSAGLYAAIRKSGFAPNLNELIEAIDAAHKGMRSAIDRVPRLAEAIAELEAQLAGDGLLDDEQDFSW